MQPFTHRDFAENRRAFRLRHNALICKLAGDRMIAALDRLGEMVEKANFNPAQPRAPGGGPGAGQWIYVEGYAQQRESDASIILANSPGIGHNGGPRLDEPPEVPKKPPTDRASQLAKAKEVAKWLAMFGARRIPAVLAVLRAVETAQWLHREWPSIQSYRDEPKALDELIQNAHEPRLGYHRHHVVEQTSAEQDGFPRSMIDGVENVVSVPIYKHHQITGWYATPNKQFGMQSPRDYLRGKTWEERQRVGQQALRTFGVLKP